MLLGLATTQIFGGEIRLPVEDVVEIRFVERYPPTQTTTRPSAFFPIDITGGFNAQCPVTDLVAQAMDHKRSLPFLEVDETLDDKVSEFVRSTYRDAPIRKLTKRI